MSLFFNERFESVLLAKSKNTVDSHWVKMRERREDHIGGGKRMASSKLLVKIQDPLADRRQILQTVKLLSEAHFSQVQLSQGKHRQ